MLGKGLSGTKNLKLYYDKFYYRAATRNASVPGHWRRLAARMGIKPGQRVLDVACGKGEWLLAVQERGAIPAGVDLSGVAIDICKSNMPSREFCIASAEALPFKDDHFDVISCLGAVEYFGDPLSALREMIRVSREGAVFLLSVPHEGFFLRRLGLFDRMRQIFRHLFGYLPAAPEYVYSLEEWERLFKGAGLVVEERWRDLHLLSWGWINGGPIFTLPFRAALALLLGVLPLKWNYQAYHRCKLDRISPSSTHVR